ncbi:MAG: AlpA family phage regulatory protein [Bauldia sp.]
MSIVFLRRSDVKRRVAIKADSTFDDLRRRDATFPRAIFPFGTRTPIWTEDSIEQWQAERIADRDAQTNGGK